MLHSDQAFHYSLLFFRSRFILPVNDFFFSLNTSFVISILLQICFVQYPSCDVNYASMNNILCYIWGVYKFFLYCYVLWIVGSLVVHQHKFSLSIISLSAYARHLRLFHFNLNSYQTVWWHYLGKPLVVVNPFWLLAHKATVKCLGDGMLVVMIWLDLLHVL